jgi:tRNA-specific 2-thiouridylase
MTKAVKKINRSKTASAKSVPLSRKKVVFVGMSGGVDSSVSAGLLKKEGYGVIGIFIKISISGDCGWKLERRAAFAAAATLNIPLYTIDLTKQYKEAVVSYMLAEYQAGRTPNPDVMCNQTVKFGAFYDWAITHGADYVATGHYAKISEKGKQRLMSRSADDNKDQTYFLWAIEKDRINKIIFPIGDLKKDEVRELAHKFKLPNASKPDSQGLCFVGEFNFKRFLRKKLGVKPGIVVDEEGREVGSHDGAYLYTIGERHGLGIHQDSRDIRPYYVVAKDIEKNTLTVSHEPLFGSAEKVGKITLDQINWLTDQEPETDNKYQARLRHRGILASCHLEKDKKGMWQIVFDEAVSSPAPGQSVVIYDGKICLGGGIIA